MESSLIPTILTLGRYVLFFWLGESDEPVHIHVAVRRPVEHATKFWQRESRLPSWKTTSECWSLCLLERLTRLTRKFVASACEKPITRQRGGALQSMFRKLKLNFLVHPRDGDGAVGLEKLTEDRDGIIRSNIK